MTQPPPASPKAMTAEELGRACANDLVLLNGLLVAARWAVIDKLRSNGHSDDEIVRRFEQDGLTEAAKLVRDYPRLY